MRQLFLCAMANFLTYICVKQDVQKILQPGEAKEMLPSIAVEKLPVTDHGVAIFTRHSTSEPELIPLVSGNPNHPQTLKNDTPCPSEVSGTSSVARSNNDASSVDQDPTSPARQLLSTPTLGSQQPCNSFENVLPASDSISLFDSSRGESSRETWYVIKLEGNFTSSITIFFNDFFLLPFHSFSREELSGGKPMSSEQHSQHQDLGPILNSSPSERNSQSSASHSNHGSLFHKEGNNCLVTSDKSQELRRLQESVHLPETLQRQSHKRVREKALIGDSSHSSNHNALSLMKANTSGKSLTDSVGYLCHSSCNYCFHSVPFI